jgi:hypothetical protein
MHIERTVFQHATITPFLTGFVVKKHPERDVRIQNDRLPFLHATLLWVI